VYIECGLWPIVLLLTFRKILSFQEAERLESETARRLREAKKLSLVVDLDQTVIHATVDPTVGEWIADETTASNPAVKVCMYGQTM
jgi:TFIIF-interacting CTD phosphatase-like protein